ncbi:MAG: hypothetical protein JW862_09040 [Anaerolineales bacterium]|nr:hypothetical protein [Anaerolineales bacterium]
MRKTYLAVILLAAFLAILVACQANGTPAALEEPTSQPVATQIEPTVEPTVEPPIEPTVEPTPLTPAANWWQDAVFYEVFVRSFQDSDRDGVGDINGLIEKLDYLNDGDPTTDDDLGVTGIWLMPVTESPSYHGYDVVDYYSVDREYGTEEDFLRLVDEAHQRGIRIIVDLVLNHTSSQHFWFQESKAGDPEFRDWYVWVAEAPSYRGPWNQTVWYKANDSYYYAVFWSEMPDLNLQNPEVTAELYDVAEFWLEEMNADGFRLDAIKHLVEDGRLQENTNATHEWLMGFYDHYKAIDPNAFAVGEAWTSTAEVLDYTGDEVDVAFAFDLGEAILNTVRGPLALPVIDEMARLVENFPPGQYATFLANHDQDRVMSQLRGEEVRAKLAATIYLTSPGVPFIYYGEEIGMMGGKPDEDIRRPMQWQGDDLGAGFTTGQPWRAPALDYQTRNVAAQEEDPDSLLNHYRALIRLRNQFPALRTGDWTLVDAGTPRIYAFLRHSGDETILVLMNVHPADLSTADYGLNLESGPLPQGVRALGLLGLESPGDPVINAQGGFTNYTPFDTIPSQSFAIIQLVP